MNCDWSQWIVKGHVYRQAQPSVIVYWRIILDQIMYLTTWKIYVIMTVDACMGRREKMCYMDEGRGKHVECHHICRTCGWGMKDGDENATCDGACDGDFECFLASATAVAKR